jgi:DNA repair protein SbcC/Rad50
VKILRIKLRNLNSLRGDHVVDFTKEPLASAPIFAITGPTGAGKSTLLDAMTLALYGRAARYEKDSNPENMMSRHTSECSAEVTFSVNKEVYRAEWQLRRARGKIDGALQPPQRFLYDAQETPLNRLSTEFNQLIEKITGLDYQRFLRSVLLAQGEFARFLRAKDDERAALLESLTGTGIYSQLGKLAHEESSRRERELAQQKLSLEHYQLMSEEQVNEKTLQMIRWEKDVSRSQEKIIALNQALLHGSNLATGLQSRAENDQQCKTLEDDRNNAAASLQKLQLHQQAQPFAQLLIQYDEAEQGAIAMQLILARSTEQLTKAQERQHHILSQALDFCEKSIHTAENRYLHACEELTIAQQLREKKVTWLNEHQHHQALTSMLPALQQRANHIHLISSDLRKKNTTLEKFTADSNLQQVQLHNLKEQAKQASDASDLSIADLATAENELKANVAPSSIQECDAVIDGLQEKQRKLDKLIALCESIDTSKSEIDALTTAWEQLAPALRESQSKIDKIDEIRVVAEREMQLLRDNVALSQRIASMEEHRAQLKDGEECPLCGAQEHPFSHRDVSGVLQERENQLRDAEINLTQLTSELLKEKASLATLEAHGIQQQKNLAALQVNHSSMLSLRSKGDRSLGITDYSLEDLTQMIEVNSQNITLIRRLHQQWVIKKQSLANAQHANAMAMQLAHAADVRLKEMLSNLVSMKQSILSQQQETDSLTKKLRDELLPFRLPMPDFPDESFVCKEWNAAADIYQENQLSLERLTIEIEQKNQAVHASEIARTEQSERERFWQLEAKKHNLVIDQLLPHPTAWQTHRDVDQVYRESEQALTKCVTENKLHSEQLEAARSKQQQLQRELLLQIQQSQFSDLPHLRQSLLAPKEAQEYSSLAQALDRRLGDLLALRGEYEKAIAQAHQLQAPDRDACLLLQDEKLTLQQQIEAMQRERTLTEVELRRNEQQQQERDAKASLLVTQINELDSWRLLSGLIGSHDGSKFRKFAQGISLDILIHHANQHLSKLTDRYRLQRQQDTELTLEIVDAYQADVSRPMASLSGGESFIVSLALALGLSDLAGRNVQIDSLFIDEGFGTLDADTLDLAITTLESLHQENKTIGVISHIDLVKERIHTKINIRKLSAGVSTLEITS